MNKSCAKVSAWLSECEDDYVLNGYDDTDADFCIKNVENESDISTDQTNTKCTLSIIIL